MYPVYASYAISAQLRRRCDAYRRRDTSGGFLREETDNSNVKLAVYNPAGTRKGRVHPSPLLGYARLLPYNAFIYLSSLVPCDIHVAVIHRQLTDTLPESDIGRNDADEFARWSKSSLTLLCERSSKRPPSTSTEFRLAASRFLYFLRIASALRLSPR